MKVRQSVVPSATSEQRSVYTLRQALAVSQRRTGGCATTCIMVVRNTCIAFGREKYLHTTAPQLFSWIVCSKEAQLVDKLANWSSTELVEF